MEEARVSAEPAGRVGSSFRAFRAVFSNPHLRRLELAFVGFNMAEQGTWIAILVFAFLKGGATAAGLVALIQLVPAALFAPLVSSLGDHFPRQRFLVASYLIQAATMSFTGAALLLDAPVPVAYVLAASAATAVTMTRPAHGSFLPSLARDPRELTAANSVAGTIESFSLLAGPAATGLILAVSSPGAVFAVMAAANAIGALLVAGISVRPPPTSSASSRHDAWSHAFGGLAQLTRDPAPRLVVGLLAAQFVVLGALDVLYVVLAIGLLGLGQSGPGYLTAAVGLGGVVGGLATLLLVGRSRLSVPIAQGVVLWGLPVALIGVVPRAWLAFLLLGVAGVGRTVADVSGRTLLQRIVPDDVLSRVFGALEGMGMAALAVGSIAVPALVIAVGTRGALIVTGAFLPLLVLLTASRLVRLEARIRVPEREIALARAVPFFAALPTPELERVASNMMPVAATAGDTIVRQGDRGHRFYVVAEGEVEVLRDGVRAATAGPGEFFGEIALLRDVPRTATVVALTDVELYVLERRDFLRAVTGHPGSGDAADAVVRQRLPQ